MCCSAAEIFAWPEDGTSMYQYVTSSIPHHWTGWAFALSDVDDSVLRAGCAATRMRERAKNRQFRCHCKHVQKHLKVRQTEETSPTNLTMSIQFSGFPSISHFPASSHPVPVLFPSMPLHIFILLSIFHIIGSVEPGLGWWVSGWPRSVMWSWRVEPFRGRSRGKQFTTSLDPWNLKSFVTNLTLGFRVSMDQVHWFYIQIKFFFDWSCRYCMRYRDKLCRASEA